MVNAVHALLYAKEPRKARAFLRDVLGWRHVDAGEGWLIFAMPPAEVGVHPLMSGEKSGDCELYLMCDDVEKEAARLRKKGVRVGAKVADRGWGLVTSVEVPGMGPVGLYQPKHPVAWRRAKAKRPARAAR